MSGTAQAGIIAAVVPDNLSPSIVKCAPMDILQRSVFDLCFPSGEGPFDVIVHVNVLLASGCHRLGSIHSLDDFKRPKKIHSVERLRYVAVALAAISKRHHRRNYGANTAI